MLEGGCVIELGGGMKRRRGGVPNEGMGVVQCWPACLSACLCVHVCVCMPLYLYLIVSVFSLFKQCLCVNVHVSVNVCVCWAES